MPTYVYRCSVCNEELEAKQGFDDEPLTFCPFCENDGLQRVIQPAMLVFKGGGWSRKKARLSPPYYTGDGEEVPGAIVKQGERPKYLKGREFIQAALSKRH